jgi:hypothetical protein
MAIIVSWLEQESPYLKGDFKSILDSWKVYVNQADPWIKIRMMRGVAHTFAERKDDDKSSNSISVALAALQNLVR